MVTQPTTDHALSSRIQRIESFLLALLATSSAILIVLGLFLPLASFTSVHRYPFSIVDLCMWAFSPAAREFERSYGGEIGVVLAVLTVLSVVSALLALVDLAFDRGSFAKLIWVRASSLAAAACLVALGWILLTVEPSVGETRHLEGALWPLLIGFALYIVTAFAPTPRAWWHGRPSPR